MTTIFLNKSFTEECAEIKNFKADDLTKLLNFDTKYIGSLIFNKKTKVWEEKKIEENSINTKLAHNIYDRITKIVGKKIVLEKYGPRENLIQVTDLISKFKNHKEALRINTDNIIQAELMEAKNLNYPIGIVLGYSLDLKSNLKELQKFAQKNNIHFFSMDFKYLLN